MPQNPPLTCRPGATEAEVRAAYRAALRRARPDLDGVDGEWVVRVQAARDALLRAAGPERRRRPRRAGSPAAYLPLRRSTWQLPEQAPAAFDVRL